MDKGKLTVREMNEDAQQDNWKRVKPSSGWTLDIENPIAWYELSDGIQKYVEIAANHGLPSHDNDGVLTDVVWAIRASARSTATELLSFIGKRKGLTIDDELYEEMRLLCCRVADD